MPWSSKEEEQGLELKRLKGRGFTGAQVGLQAIRLWLKSCGDCVGDSFEFKIFARRVARP